MFKGLRIKIPIIAAVAIGVSYFLFLVFVTPFMDNTHGQKEQLQPSIVSTVIIPEDAQNAPNRGFEPQVITVMIGINNTVRWVNQDSVPHGISTPDDNNADIDFTNAVEKEKQQHPFLMPGEDSFQYTFNKPGRIDYHMVPHPQMKGAVIVLPAS
jgi:plastocyanin